MNMRDPVRSITWALMKAVDHDLDGLDSPLAAKLFGACTSPVMARPKPDQCEVAMFTQAWSSNDLGYRDRGFAQTVETETVVITGPGGDACVYASTQLLYHVRSPNRLFFLDLMSQRMRGKSECAAYEGRDSADLEAVSYEVSSAVAKLCGVAGKLGREEASRVERVIGSLVGRMNEGLSSSDHAIG
ncbi:hypothetical protein [Piscinibacter gummiphilus]|uniref:Uncharacterized protein n=1 Tax=Piscinibacter gummiphilus TaxID=946333 RepID=A0ABZ0D1Y0_9BURK|nr:hypothetical protein [Piscinibacter gummiphilus]WOB11257.1 hypothetical protein RXV79_26870 [Piscinibacter gummiphilus]